MIFKFITTHEIEGTKVFSSPDGWSGAVIGFERHKVFHSLQRYFRSTFKAYGSNGYDDGCRDYFKYLEKTYGPNAKINITIKVTENNLLIDDLYDQLYNESLDEILGFYVIFTGLIPIFSFIETLDDAHLLQISFSESSFWTKLMSRFEIPVNVLANRDLDNNVSNTGIPSTIVLPSQPINKATVYSGHSGEDDTAADCYIRTTGPIILFGHQVINGVQTTDNMRVLVRYQAAQSTNGIYEATSGAWQRSADANTPTELENLIVKVTHGDTGIGTYRQTNSPIIVGTSSIVLVSYDYVSEYELLRLPSQATGSSSRFEPSTASVFNQSKSYVKYSPATEDADQREIETSSSLVYNLLDTANDVGNQLEIKQEKGPITLTGTIKNRFRLAGSWQNSNRAWYFTTFGITTNVYLQKNAEPIILLGTNHKSHDTGINKAGPGIHNIDTTLDLIINIPNTIINVLPSDIVKVYLKHSFDFFYSQDTTDHSGEKVLWDERILYGGLIDGSFLNFNFKSYTPQTQSEGFLIHDLGSYIVEKVTGKANALYSEYLGSPDTVTRQYINRGCASDYANLLGLHIRGYNLTNKPFFMSMKEWYEGLAPILNFGLSLKTIDSAEVVECKKIDDYYDKSKMSVLISNVRRIKRNYDLDNYFNHIKIGYETSRASDVLGSLDDPQTIREYSTILEGFGRKIEFMSPMIAASLAFEATRRTTEQKTTSYEYDNSFFILAVKKFDNLFKPKLTEEFIITTNLLNADERYNKDLTPARNFLRFRRFLSNGLQQYLDSVFKFVKGEGNYDMESKMIKTLCEQTFDGELLSEKQDIGISADPLFFPNLYDIEHDLTLEQFKLIDENRHLAIGISQTDKDHKPFFIQDLQFNIVEGDLKLLAWPDKYFDIVDVEDTSQESGTSGNLNRIFDDTFDETFD